MPFLQSRQPSDSVTFKNDDRYLSKRSNNMSEKSEKDIVITKRQEFEIREDDLEQVVGGMRPAVAAEKKLEFSIFNKQ